MDNITKPLSEWTLGEVKAWVEANCKGIAGCEYCMVSAVCFEMPPYWSLDGVRSGHDGEDGDSA